MDVNSRYAGRELVVCPTGPGSDTRTIQQAIDSLAEIGGGTVRLQPGRYVLMDSIYLRCDVAIIGQGDVVIARGPLVASDLAVDADIGQFEFTPVDAAGFKPSMGVRFHDAASGWAHQPAPLSVAGVEDDGRVLLNEMNVNDRLASNHARAVNYFPMIYAHRADDALVENLTIDAAVQDDGELTGVRLPAVHLYRSTGCTLRRLTISGARGDAICFEASVRALVEDCETFGNTFHGVHLGSHSAWSVVRRCRIHHNASDGLYVCWGIRHSLFEENDIHHNGSSLWRSGISIGHKDTDNLFTRNHVYENCKHGICVRRKTAANGAHRNTYRENIIENNGQDPAGIPERLRELLASEPKSCGVLVMGITHDLAFERNIIRETRPAGRQWQRHGLYIAEGVERVNLADNEITGHPDDDIVDNSAPKDRRAS